MAFSPLTSEDQELFDSYKEAINARAREAFPSIPTDFDLKPTSVRRQIVCGTFYTYKATLPDNQVVEVLFLIGGKRITPLVGPPDIEVRKATN